MLPLVCEACVSKPALERVGAFTQRSDYQVLEEVNERYLEIREVATGTVVTVIEILSPKNKRAGEGRVTYERKRNQVLASA